MLPEWGKACQRTAPVKGSRVLGPESETYVVSRTPKRMLESPAPPGGTSEHGVRSEFSTGVEKTVENKGFSQSQA